MDMEVSLEDLYIGRFIEVTGIYILTLLCVMYILKEENIVLFLS